MSACLLLMLLLCLCIGSISSDDTKCYKNEGLGNAEGNVYYCQADKPDCCELEQEFSCCETDEAKNWREQLQLWGTIAGLVVVIAIVFMCCKNDYTFCNGDDRTISQRLGFRKKKPELLQPTDLSSVDQEKETPATSIRRYPYDRLPPLPPTTPYPDSSGRGGSGLYPPLDTAAGYRGKSNAGFDVDDDGYRY